MQTTTCCLVSIIKETPRAFKGALGLAEDRVLASRLCLSVV